MTLSVPEVTVITPVFNGEKYLEECLDSVASQSGVSVEHIVIDDGSTDRTAEIIGRYPHVVYIKQANSGANVARNLGIKLARAPYIKFLDADDILEKDALNMQYGISSKLDDKYVTYGYCIELYPNGKEVIKKRQSIQSSDDNLIVDLILRKVVTSLPLYPTSGLRKVGGFDERMIARQEWLLNLRLSANGYSFLYHDVLTYKQRFHEDPFRISNRVMRVELELKNLDQAYESLPKPTSKAVNDAWAAYIWKIGRHFSSHSDLKSARLCFQKAFLYSSDGFKKHLSLKYKISAFILGWAYPDYLLGKLNAFKNLWNKC